MTGTNSPIGIFDSGVGGLTILSELQKLLPRESFIYVADQAYAPYGKKTKIQVKTRALKIAEFLKSKNCKLIIIACNTATIASIDFLRNKISIPIVGVVPVIKTAAKISKTKNVTLYATPSTIKSAYTNKLIKKFAHDIIVHKNGTTGLERIIEKGEIDSLKINHILKKSLSSVSKQRIDVIILGCTHYPFIKGEIKKIVPSNVFIIDSGQAVARQVKRVLKANNELSKEKRNDLYYTTKDTESFERVVAKLTKKSIISRKLHI